MRGVWILLEYMKWKKGTDGGGVGGKGEKKRPRRGGALAFSAGVEGNQGSVYILSCHCGGNKKKENANERALTLEGI